MPSIARSEVVDPKDLDSAALEALTGTLYDVHCEIFAGVSREEFARYVIQSSADQTRIRVSYGDDGEIAGYVAVHAFRRRFRGESCTVTRAEAGLRRRYRGDGSFASFFVSHLLKTQWTYGDAHYYLGCLVHPSSYAAFASRAASIWPAPGVETPPDALAFMNELGEAFHLEVIDPARPLVRRVGWITRDSEVERRYWQSTDLPAPRFFIEQNPGYGAGHGLITLVPLDPASLAKVVVSWGGNQIKKRLSRTASALERSVIRPRLDAESAEDLLAAVEEMTGLDLDAVRKLGVVGTRFPVPARTVLFRAGDRADAMYIVLQGSVFVLDEGPDGEEIVIDQLGPNTMVGEMALMTGQPRTATARAAASSVLLRLELKDLAKLLAAEPRLEDELWQRITARVFGRRIRAVTAHSHLSRAAEEAWYGAGAARAIEAGERLSVDAAGVLVLAHGEVVVDGVEGWMSLSAPAVARLPAGAVVVGVSACRVAILPANPPASE